MEQTEEEDDISNGSWRVGTQVSIPKASKNVGTVIRYKNQSTSKKNIPVVLAPKQTNAKV